MSELTPCNFCSLSDIKYRAKQRGQVVTTLIDDAGWTDVYVHPSDVTELPAKRGHDDEWSKYQVASMMKITDHCVC